jgi:hypothetical protein
MAMRDSAVAAFAKNAGQVHASRILGECGYSNGQVHASRILGECGYSNGANCTLPAFLANAATAMVPTARFPHSW